MLSNQTPNFNPGRQPQRQNSTPDIFANTGTLWNEHHPQAVSHRRGLSFDQPTNTQPQFTPHLRPQDILDFIPRGFEKYQRHLLQEAHHMQRLAGPGQPEPRQPSNEQDSRRNTRLEPYPEYGRCVFTKDLLMSTAPSLSDTNLPKHLDTNRTGICYEPPSFDNTDFAGYLEGYEILTRPNLATTGYDQEARKHNLPNENGAIISNTLKPSVRAGPARPCTPPNQTNSCKCRSGKNIGISC